MFKKIFKCTMNILVWKRVYIFVQWIVYNEDYCYSHLEGGSRWCGVGKVVLQWGHAPSDTKVSISWSNQAIACSMFVFFTEHQCRSNINKYDCGILSIGHEFINKMWFPGWQLCTYSTGILENLLQQGLYKKDIYARSSCLVLAPSCSIIKLDLMFLGVCKISTHLYSIEATQIFMKNCQCFVKSAYL